MKNWRAFRPEFIVLVFIALAISNGLVFVLGRSLGGSQTKISQTRRVQARILVLVRQNTETRVALCTFKVQLGDNAEAQARQISQSRKFLRAHPDGLPSLGISRAQLRQSVASQASAASRTRAAYRSLSNLRCPKGEK